MNLCFAVFRSAKLELEMFNLQNSIFETKFSAEFLDETCSAEFVHFG